MDKRKPIRKHLDDNPEQSHPFLYEQLSKLSISLGKPKHNVKDSIKYLLRKHSFDNDTRFELVVLNNLRLHFEDIQRFGDSRNNDLNEVRANLCMHLYRELVRVESDEIKRYQYLKLFYELLDAGEPDNMTEAETLNYRLVVIDKLNNQVNNLLKRLECLEVDQVKSEDSIGSFAGLSPVQSELNVEVYARKELVNIYHCELKGLSYKQGSLVSTNLNNDSKTYTSKSTLPSLETKNNENLNIFLNSKQEQYEAKELSMNFKTAEKDSLNHQPQDELNIFDNFQSRIPRLKRLESLPSSNTFLSKELKKYEVRRGLLSLCQTENFFKPKPIESKITIMGYSNKEHILSKYGNMKGFVYQYGHLVYVEPMNNLQETKNELKSNIDQANFIQIFESSKPAKEFLSNEFENCKLDNKFQLKAIQNVGKLKYYAVLEHSSYKYCKIKGILWHLESLMWYDVELRYHNTQKKENETIYNDFKILKEILTGKIYDFSKERTDENCKMTVEKEKQNLIDSIDNRFLNKFNSAVLEQELENYKGLLDKLQESQANLRKCIQRSLSKVQISPKKMDNLANILNIPPDLKRIMQTEKVLQDPSSSFEIAEKDNPEHLIIKEQGTRSSSANNNYLTNILIKCRREPRERTFQTNVILYKSNIVNHFIYPPCRMKGFKLNSGSLEWVDIEEKNHEYILSQFMEMDDVVTDIQKALNQIIENNFRIKESTGKSARNKNSDTAKELVLPQGSYKLGSKGFLPPRLPKNFLNEQSKNKFLHNGLEQYKLLLNELEVLSKEERSKASLPKNQYIAKGLENYEQLLDELEELRLKSNQNINKIVQKYQFEAKPVTHLTDSLTTSLNQIEIDQCQNKLKKNEDADESSNSDNSSVVTVRSLCQISETEKSIDEEDSCEKKSGSMKKWQHQRHVIAAPSSIIHFLKSNPGSQCSRINSKNEKGAFMVLRWQRTDSSDNAIKLSDDENIRDSFNSMLKSSQIRCRSTDLTGTYLLLILSDLGYIYRAIQDQQAELKGLGKNGLALSQRQRMELLLYKEFHIKLQKCEKAAGLYSILKLAKQFQSRFQWMVEINCRILKEGNLFLTLLKEQQKCNNKILQKWLLLVSQPMLEKLSRWLRRGELPDTKNDKFFIMENLSVPTANFWHERFNLLDDYIPIYFNKQLCLSLMSVGKYHRYGNEFLGIDAKISLNYQKFINAFQLTYQKCEIMPLYDLITILSREISLNILNYHEQPIDIFYKLFKYVLLRDIHFAVKLIEYLEPVLEQSANLFDLEQFNYMLEQILTDDNIELYIEEVPSDGNLCWSRFKLSWNWSHKWQALLGKNIDIYSSIFTDLWKFHYANYVLCERLSRQQKHFAQRIKLEFIEDVNQVQELFHVLIDIFINVMNIIRDYICKEVLDDAYAQLKEKCHEVKTLDDIIEAHKVYLNAIKMDFFQTKKGNVCIVYLNQLYKFIFDLDALYQKFISECQQLMIFFKSYPNTDDISSTLFNFNCSCKDKWSTLNGLGDKFQLCLNELMLNLFTYGSKKSKLLAEKLGAKDLYKTDKETLQNV